MCTQHSTIQYRPLLTFWLEVLVLRFSSLPPVSDYQERQTQHTRKGLPPCCSDTCIALATPPTHPLFTCPTHCSPAPLTVHLPHPLFTCPTHCSPAPPTVHLPHSPCIHNARDTCAAVAQSGSCPQLCSLWPASHSTPPQRPLPPH